MTGHIIFTAVLFVLGVSGALILWKRASVPLPSQEEVEAVAGKLAGPLHLAQLTAHEGRILHEHAGVVLLALMLEAIAEAGPSGIDRETLADVTDFTASGGTFSTYLGILRRNGLVEVDGPMVRAMDVLFP